MGNSARAEWHPLREVLVHRPGIELFFGLLAPYSFLFERAFSVDQAIYEHTALEHALTDAGVSVLRLKRFALEVERRHPKVVEQFRADAAKRVRYSGPKEMVARARAALRRNLPAFDAETLFNIFLLRPSIRLERRPGARGSLPHVELDGPLANLFFLRDPQALTAGGFVLGRMSKPQRRHETELTARLLRASGATIAGAIRPPGTLEGGDFLPAGAFALLGLGDRTNASGAHQFLAMPTGFDEVGLVHQPAHPAIPGPTPDPMLYMHLDSYLNLPGEKIAVGCEVLMRAARVEVYRRSGRGRMVRESRTRSLSEYLAEKRFEVIGLSTLEQMGYASNFLCVRDRKILAVDVEQELEGVLLGLAESSRRHPRRYRALFDLVRRERATLRSGRGFFPHIPAVRDRGIEAVPLGLREITGGYGGAHCMTCVMHRATA